VLFRSIEVCKLLDQNPKKNLSDLIAQLPKTYNSPTMSPSCPDENKYQVIEGVVKIIKEKYKKNIKIADQEIISILTVNGIRFTLSDGSWGLVRASSNTPNLVVVCESLVSESIMKDIFMFIDGVLREFKDVGDYDQSI
jgi:phosphomannomutase/phosphoglucomutase